MASGQGGHVPPYRTTDNQDRQTLKLKELDLELKNRGSLLSLDPEGPGRMKEMKHVSCKEPQARVAWGWTGS